MNVTSDLIDNIIDSNNSEATEEILNLLYAKAQAKLDAHKKEVASTMFISPEEE
jgi:hypothetical protein